MEVRAWPRDWERLNQGGLGSNCPFIWEVSLHGQGYRIEKANVLA